MEAPIPTSALRAALSRFATGVTIITARAPGGAPIGLTANSFAALSLEPPLILWSLRRSSPNLDAFVAAPHFAVNVLAANQVELARRFAAPIPDKFASGRWSHGLGEAPVLAGCAAVFECAQRSHQAAGDHVLFIGEVLRVADAAQASLVYLSGRYCAPGDSL